MSDFPDLLTIREVQAIFRRNYRATLRRVLTHLAPLGGVLKCGPRYLVHRWAIDEYLASITVGAKPPERRTPIWVQQSWRPVTAKRRSGRKEAR